eukprot:IDg22153t1
MAPRISPEDFSKLVNGLDKINRPASDYESIPVLPVPNGVEPLNPDEPDCNVYVIRSVFDVPVLSTSLPITMTIVREGGDLTLINSFRVPANVEDEILQLGAIRRVVKLGQYHGAAGDAYWVRSPRFSNPEYWAPHAATVAAGLVVTHTLQSGAQPPINGALLSSMADIPFPEYVMTVPTLKSGRLLITCDALMHICSVDDLPAGSREMLEKHEYIFEQGVPRPTRNWTGTVVGVCGSGPLKTWMEELIEMEWSCFVSAHGPPIVNCDHSKIMEAVDSLLSSPSLQLLSSRVSAGLEHMLSM